MNSTSSPFLMRNSKQTLVFNFNNAVTNEHVHGDDDDESSDVLIGKKNPTTFKLMLMLILFTCKLINKREN